MDELAKEYIIEFFNKRIIHFKESPEAVGWTPKGQKLRYEKILELMNPQGLSLLDFGCGRGDFYGFLKERNIKCRYVGIDINPTLIKEAKTKYPEGEFIVTDIEETPFLQKFDYTVAIGVFNLNIHGVKESMKNCIKILYGNTNKELIFTCLDARTKNKDIELVYFYPDELKEILSFFCENFIIYDSLVKGDLFVVLKKNIKNF
ncbi:MAG: class I SAM-dependent methyltransferase [Thermodesulfovibrio sp.]|nr:class I SAM-dependent methyltransferase [Thermodesulfovibrio sp.]